MTARALWTCPECGVRLIGAAVLEDVARTALLDSVREHLAMMHADSRDLTSAAAQAGGGWLAAAGHLVELWGGPYDGARVWCPPGPLPGVIGVKTSADGQLVPVPAAWCLWGGADQYVLGEDGTGSTPADRYVWTP